MSSNPTIKLKTSKGGQTLRLPSVAAGPDNDRLSEYNQTVNFEAAVRCAVESSSSFIPHCSDGHKTPPRGSATYIIVQ